MERPSSSIAETPLHSADIKEYNPDPAIHLWNKAAIRGQRPTQKTWWKLKRKQNNQHCDNIDFLQSSSDDSGTDSELDDHEPNNVTTLPESDAAALFNSDCSESKFDGF